MLHYTNVFGVNNAARHSNINYLCDNGLMRIATENGEATKRAEREGRGEGRRDRDRGRETIYRSIIISVGLRYICIPCTVVVYQLAALSCALISRGNGM